MSIQDIETMKNALQVDSNIFAENNDGHKNLIDALINIWEKPDISISGKQIFTSAVFARAKPEHVTETGFVNDLINKIPTQNDFLQSVISNIGNLIEKSKFQYNNIEYSFWKMEEEFLKPNDTTDEYKNKWNLLWKLSQLEASLKNQNFIENYIINKLQNQNQLNAETEQKIRDSNDPLWKVLDILDEEQRRTIGI